jgi:hypothetical protein
MRTIILKLVLYIQLVHCMCKSNFTTRVCICWVSLLHIYWIEALTKDHIKLQTLHCVTQCADSALTILTAGISRGVTVHV